MRRTPLVALVIALSITPAAGAGGEWERVPTPNPTEGRSASIRGLDCVTPDDCWAIGTHSAPTGAQALAMHWDGDAWTIVPTPTPQGHSLVEMWGVSCPQADRCWAAGSSFDGAADYAPLLLAWDGEAWSIEGLEDSPTPGSDFLYDVECAGPEACWAVGRHLPGWGGAGALGRVLLHRWDGESWTLAPTPAGLPPQGSQVVSVTCVSVGDCWAVGSQAAPAANQTLALRWDGETWTAVPTPNTGPDQANALNGVTCVSASDCWAVGIYSGQQNQALAMHWDGASWSRVAIPSSGPDLANVVTGVDCVATDECYAVGYQREQTWLVTLIERWDGERWKIVPSPNSAYGQTNNLWPVECIEGDCWTGGWYYVGAVSHTIALRREGTPPLPGPEAPIPNLVDVIGDANALNGQGLGQEAGQPTEPASVASADLVGVWLETAYDTVIERDEQGAVRFVRHVPTALRMRVKTSAPATPTFGPTVTYRVPVDLGDGCEAWLHFHVRGDAPGSLDREGAELFGQGSCVLTSPSGETLAFDGQLAIAEFPLATSAGLLEAGTLLSPADPVSVRVAGGVGSQQRFTAPVLDEGPPISPFTIGSDVPPDIDCRATPGEPACAG